MVLPPITWLGTIAAMRRSLPRPARSHVAAAVGAGVILALGVRLLLAAGLGVAPLDIALVAVSDLTGVGLGFVAIAVQSALLVTAWRLGRPPVAATWVFTVSGGIALQAVLVFDIGTDALVARLGLWAVGFAFVAVAIGLVVAGTRAGGSFELLSQAGEDRGVPAAYVRTALEVTIVVIGVALGGPLGVGSVVFALAIGPAVALATSRWNATLCRWTAPASVASSSA